MVLSSGCGIISILGTPTRHERKIDAEYDLAAQKKQKILVLVEQPVWIGAGMNLRYSVTNKINKKIIYDIRIPSINLITYDSLSEFRSNNKNFSLLSAVEVGEALNAGLVLLIEIDSYELNKVAESDYYRGLLGSQAALFDVGTGKKLWPEEGKSKSIKVGFDIEERGPQVGNVRLVAALAHCTIRHLYNCPKDRFKTSDDRSSVAWQSWE